MRPPLTHGQNWLYINRTFTLHENKTWIGRETNVKYSETNSLVIEDVRKTGVPL